MGNRKRKIRRNWLKSPRMARLSKKLPRKKVRKNWKTSRQKEMLRMKPFEIRQNKLLTTQRRRRRTLRKKERRKRRQNKSKKLPKPKAKPRARSEALQLKRRPMETKRQLKS